MKKGAAKNELKTHGCPAEKVGLACLPKSNATFGKGLQNICRFWFHCYRCKNKKSSVMT